MKILGSPGAVEVAEVNLPPGHQVLKVLEETGAEISSLVFLSTSYSERDYEYWSR